MWTVSISWARLAWVRIWRERERKSEVGERGKKREMGRAQYQGMTGTVQCTCMHGHIQFYSAFNIQ